LQAWLDKNRPQFSTTTFAQGEYDRALSIFRDGPHVVSLNMINGGVSQHDNSPYYPLPFAPNIVSGVADSGGLRARVTVAAPLTRPHPAAAQVSGSGLTFTTALRRAHVTGAAVSSDLPTPGAANRYANRRTATSTPGGLGQP
jgi:hypothetical protein